MQRTIGTAAEDDGFGAREDGMKKAGGRTSGFKSSAKQDLLILQ
ncbi:hypothetical protein PSE_1784 [Pseudovibrio sp. FO-BEG1]|nr:hypothetical protein PSE_1784 [Pseudovibrio sp. FO-BEG1]